MKLQTGYFARPVNGPTGKSTNVHIVDGRMPICGYKPHHTMQFQWNANGVVLSYVGCEKCKENLKYLYSIDSYEDRSQLKYYASFYESTFGVDVRSIIKNHDRVFTTRAFADEWAKHCIKLFKSFMRSISKGEKVEPIDVDFDTKSIKNAKEVDAASKKWIIKANEIINTHKKSGLSLEDSSRAAETTVRTLLEVGIYPAYQSLYQQTLNYLIQKNSKK
jgi:hypothetical protein